jgi:hypothetical protein
MRYVASVNWTVFVGILGVVATAVTAWVGSWNTRRATERTVDAGTAANLATLLADREGRLWERRAAAYEQMLAVVLQRKHLRGFDMVIARVETDHDLEEFLKKFALPSTFETESRLVAYASEPVLTAYRTADQWHRESLIAAVQLNTIRKAEDSGQRPGEVQEKPSQAQVLSADELKLATDKAKGADEALIDVMREELRSKPEAAMPLAGLPALR